MSREIDKVRDKALEPFDDTQERGYPLGWPRMSGMFTFRYSSTEIFSEGGNLHVKMKETRYEDGRIKSEECEGTLDRQAYDRMVDEAQGYLLNQMANFVKLLYSPFSGGR